MALEGPVMALFEDSRAHVGTREPCQGLFICMRDLYKVQTKPSEGPVVPQFFPPEGHVTVLSGSSSAQPRLQCFGHIFFSRPKFLPNFSQTFLCPLRVLIFLKDPPMSRALNLVHKYQKKKK